MSKALSVKLRDELFIETNLLAKRQRQPRNAYINDAIAFYNKLQQRRDLGRILRAESNMVREDSMRVLAAFESLEDELPE
jgi:hypothetical protein